MVSQGTEKRRNGRVGTQHPGPTRPAGHRRKSSGHSGLPSSSRARRPAKGRGHTVETGLAPDAGEGTTRCGTAGLPPRAHTHTRRQEGCQHRSPPLPALTRCLRLSRRAAGSSPCWGAGPTPHPGRRRLPPDRPGAASLHERWRGGGHHAAACQHRPWGACAARRHHVTRPPPAFAVLGRPS